MSIITNFSPEELLYLNGGIVGGQYFQNLIQTLAETNKEQRFNTFSIPLFRGQLTNLLLNEDQLAYLQAFYMRRRGTEQGFRWLNPIDYFVTPYKEGVLEIDPDTWTIGGVMEDQGIFSFTPAKIYSSKGHITKKPIYLIRNNTVDLYESGVYLQSVLLNSLGQFDYYGNIAELSIKAQFDTPVWFTQNELPTVIQGVDADDDGLFKISAISLEERLLDFLLF